MSDSILAEVTEPIPPYVSPNASPKSNRSREGSLKSNRSREGSPKVSVRSSLSPDKIESIESSPRNEKSLSNKIESIKTSPNKIELTKSSPKKIELTKSSPINDKLSHDKLESIESSPIKSISSPTINTNITITTSNPLQSPTSASKSTYYSDLNNGSLFIGNVTSSNLGYNSTFFNKYVYPKPYGGIQKNMMFRRFVFKILYLLSKDSPYNILKSMKYDNSKIKKSSRSNRITTLSNGKLFGETFFNTECDKFYDIMDIEPAKRTESDLIFISNILEKASYFAEMPFKVLRQIAKAMVLETYANEHAVFYQGEVGTKFYVIVEGSVDIKVKRISGFSYTAAVLTAGNVFGELAVAGKANTAHALSQKKDASVSDPFKAAIRTATVVASSELNKLIAIPAEVYSFLKSVVVDRAKQRADFLRNLNLPMFSSTTEAALDKVCSIMYSKRYARQELIVSQNKPYSSLYFIKSGEVSIVKKIRVPNVIYEAAIQSNENLNASFPNTMDPSKSKDGYTSMIITLGTLTAGDFFGNFPSEFGKFDPFPTSMVSLSEVVVYSVSSDEVLDKLVENNIFRKGLNVGSAPAEQAAVVNNSNMSSLELMASTSPLLTNVLAYLKTQDMSEHDCILNLSNKLEWDAYKQNTLWTVKKDHFSKRLEKNVNNGTSAIIPNVFSSIVPNHVIKPEDDNLDFENYLLEGQVPSIRPKILSEMANQKMKRSQTVSTLPPINKSSSKRSITEFKLSDNKSKSPPKSAGFFSLKSAKHVPSALNEVKFQTKSYHSALARSIITNNGTNSTKSKENAHFSPIYAQNIAKEINRKVLSKSASMPVIRTPVSPKLNFSYKPPGSAYHKYEDESLLVDGPTISKDIRPPSNSKTLITTSISNYNTSESSQKILKEFNLEQELAFPDLEKVLSFSPKTIVKPQHSKPVANRNYLSTPSFIDLNLK